MTFWDAWGRFTAPFGRAWVVYIRGITRISMWAAQQTLRRLRHGE